MLRSTSAFDEPTPNDRKGKARSRALQRRVSFSEPEAVDMEDGGRWERNVRSGQDQGSQPASKQIRAKAEQRQSMSVGSSSRSCTRATTTGCQCQCQAGQSLESVWSEGRGHFVTVKNPKLDRNA